MFARCGFRLRVIARQQIFEDHAQQLRIEGDRGFIPRAFVHREIVLIKQRDQSQHRLAAVVFVAIGVVQIHTAIFLFRRPEEFIRHRKKSSACRLIGKGVDRGVGFVFVQTGEQAAVQKRDVAHQFKEARFAVVGEKLLVAVDRVNVILFVAPPIALPDAELTGLRIGLFRIQRGEEEVLQDRPVIGAIVALRLENGVHKVTVEELIRHQILLFHEPNEDHPGNQADQRHRVLFVIGPALRESHHPQRPEKPVGELLVKFFVQSLNGKDFGQQRARLFSFILQKLKSFRNGAAAMPLTTEKSIAFGCSGVRIAAFFGKIGNAPLSAPRIAVVEEDQRGTENIHLTHQQTLYVDAAARQLGIGFYFHIENIEGGAIQFVFGHAGDLLDPRIRSLPLKSVQRENVFIQRGRLAEDRKENLRKNGLDAGVITLEGRLIHHRFSMLFM